MTNKKAPLVVALVSITATCLFGQTVADYENSITSPTDGGGGPGLFFSNASTATNAAGNMQSTGTDALWSYRLAGIRSAGYFGNADYAYQVDTAFYPGVPVSSSAATDYLSGTTSTISFLFKTPETLSGNQSMVSRGLNYATDPIGFFEVGLSGSTLRIGHDSNAFAGLGSVEADTWYYFAASYDTSVGTQELNWYYGEAGSGSLNTGNFTILAGGEASDNIYLGGRELNQHYEGFLQEVAMWDRVLSTGAIQDQFNATAIPEPSTFALLGAMCVLGIAVMRRRRK